MLGVLPMGTFNHFAKDLGMTAELAAATKFLADAEVTAVDVGEVNGRVFVNNASIGVYPKMVGEREDIRARRGWGKIRAAPVAVVRTLRRLPVSRLRLTVDEAAPIVVVTPFLFVGNGLFDEHGERVGQRTSLTDQNLGVYVIAATSPWRLIANAVGPASAVSKLPRTWIAERANPWSWTRINQCWRSRSTANRPNCECRLSFCSRAGALRVLAAPEPKPQPDPPR